jgi:hypothetical protein
MGARLICSEPGCNDEVRIRNLCKCHYEQGRREAIKARLHGKPCAVPDCSANAVARGWCDPHYRRWKRTGSPVRATPEQRFWRNVQRGRADDCWPWLASGWPKGYGAFRINGQTVAAHRFSYELHHGPIPEGLTVDHLCRNPSCVNPAHLEAVTFRENVLRGTNMAARYARRDTCSRGHQFDYLRKDGARGCRQCDRIRHAAAAKQSGDA